ncbi:MAG: hypothetical protein JNM69_12460, partial [Archangium sp.]|nr:hypothetical protein [Archangium sp.]
MISLVIAMLLTQQPERRLEFLPPDLALEGVFPQPWREVVGSPESVTLEGLIPIAKRSREVKVRWRRTLIEEPESVKALQRVILDGESYKIPGGGFQVLKLCGRQIPNLRVTFTSAERVVSADICFDCGRMLLRFDEKGRRVRSGGFDLAQRGWLDAFAPLVPDDDYVAWSKRRRDEIDARI